MVDRSSTCCWLEVGLHKYHAWDVAWQYRLRHQIEWRGGLFAVNIATEWAVGCCSRLRSSSDTLGGNLLILVDLFCESPVLGYAYSSFFRQVGAGMYWCARGLYRLHRGGCWTCARRWGGQRGVYFWGYAGSVWACWIRFSSCRWWRADDWAEHVRTGSLDVFLLR